MGEELRPWLCGVQKGHVLGMVRKNGSGVRQLLLYRHAVDVEAVEMAEVDVIAVLDGRVMDVRCSVCGEVRTWMEDAARQESRGREPRGRSGSQGAAVVARPARAEG